MSVVQFPMLVGARVGSAFDEIFRAPAQVDAAAVGKVVAHHALDLGCSESNILAAVSWAIRNGHDTLSAIKCGKMRAEQLRIRELSAAVRRA